MIRYSLKCANDHNFDSWFASSSAYDSLHKAGQIACPVCGNHEVSKSLMAPLVAAEDRPLSAPSPEADQITQLREAVEANSEDVGNRFATEARAMHEGAAPSRPIHGEAKITEAKALIEDGVPVVPLPFMSKSKAN